MLGKEGRKVAVVRDPFRLCIPLGEFWPEKLTSGTELNMPDNSIERKLLAFIRSNQPVDKETWFDFDRLTFDTGKATLQASSQEQLTNSAEILKAYPAVTVKLGGYTDNTGSPAANLKLSQDRASSVRAELEKMGISNDRLVAEGYGQAHPVASNDTEAGRSRNRRISIRVTKK